MGEENSINDRIFPALEDLFLYMLEIEDYTYDDSKKNSKDRIVYALVIHIVYAYENRIVDALEDRKV